MSPSRSRRPARPSRGDGGDDRGSHDRRPVSELDELVAQPRPGRPSPPTIGAVLTLVERIPRGKVMTYGDIAEYLGGVGPRRIGRILALHGSGVPWWRVLRADGTCADPVREVQMGRLRRERVALRGPDGDRVDLRAARWDGQDR